MPKILIAEDDPQLRELLHAILRPRFPELTLVQNGAAALEHLLHESVDVLVTDWLMPELDGIELIRRVRAQCHPSPFIIMSTVLSSPERREQALRSGADDFMAKPWLPSAVLASIKLATQRQVSSQRIPRPPRRATLVSARTVAPSHVVVAVAASTGGPDALHSLFDDPGLPRDCAFLVALHGPAWMHKSMVDALCRSSPLKVQLAEHGVRALPGNVYFACNDRHLLIDASLRLRLDDSPPEHYLRPAADPLFRSMARSLGRHALTVVLTGMGSDGTLGAAEVAAAGGVVLVQDPSTAVLGSMPAAAIAAGLATEVVPLSAMAHAVARRAMALHRVESDHARR